MTHIDQSPALRPFPVSKSTVTAVLEAARFATEAQERMRPYLELAEIHRKRMQEIAAPLTSTFESVSRIGSSLSEAFSRLGTTALPAFAEISKLRESLATIGTPTDSLSSDFFSGTHEVYISRPDPYVRIHPGDQEDIVEAVVARITSAKVRNRACYPLPRSAAWEKLRIQFVDGHTVKVKYAEMPTATFDYKDMGFLDHKTNNPDKKWEFLHGMASHGGMWPVEFFRKDYHRTTKYQLSQRFKHFFDMEADPFEPYARREGYRVRFILKSYGDRNVFDE